MHVVNGRGVTIHWCTRYIGRESPCTSVHEKKVCLPALSLTESGMKRVGSEESVRKLATS